VTLGYNNYTYRLVQKLRAEVEAFEADTQRTEADLKTALIQTRRQLFEMTMLVSALVETLVADGKLDPDVLEGRVENLRVAEPWSKEHPEPTTAVKPFACAVCFRAMEMGEGTMLGDGLHCGGCMGKRA
jgi:hypothetical protein